jgi:peptidase E
MRSVGPNPRGVWISPQTTTGHEKFPEARAAFQRLGFETVERCDIDEEPDSGQLAALHQFDVIYLSGGDPLVFRQNLLRTGLDHRLRECWLAGRVVVAASGGAMQLTANVSLFRLLNVAFGDALAEHGGYAGLRLVPYELLPHLNRFEPTFLELVRRYSERLSCDVLALSDAAAVVHHDADPCRVHGEAVWLRRGIVTRIDSRANPERS